MTTEDNVEVVETEVIEPTPPRKLEELLVLDSYQDMSDEEIELVIDYKCKMAVAGKALESIKSVENDARRATDAILDGIIDNAVKTQAKLSENMAERQYHKLQPLAVNAVTLELEPMEVGDSVG